jgi:hypothetical protein
MHFASEIFVPNFTITSKPNIIKTKSLSSCQNQPSLHPKHMIAGLVYQLWCFTQNLRYPVSVSVNICYDYYHFPKVVIWECYFWAMITEALLTGTQNLDPEKVVCNLLTRASHMLIWWAACLSCKTSCHTSSQHPFSFLSTCLAFWTWICFHPLILSLSLAISPLDHSYFISVFSLEWN